MKQTCSQCGEDKICSSIHITDTDDVEENFRLYCDKCFMILLFDSHKQLVRMDYIKGMEIAMGQIVTGKIDVGEPN